MSAEDIRKYLSGPGEIEKRIRDREEKIAALRSVAARVTPSLHQAPGSPGNGEDHKLENLIAKIDELERENREDEILLSTLCLEISDRLDALPNVNHRRILRLSSIGRRSNAEICREMNYSESYVRRMKMVALEELAKSWKESAG